MTENTPTNPTNPTNPQSPDGNDGNDIPLWLRRAARRLLVVGAIVCLVWFFWQARDALLPFIVGSILAYLLIPLINRLNTHMPRWSSILVVYVAGIVLLMSIVAYIVPVLSYQTNQLVATMPDVNLQDVRDDITTWLGEYKRLVPPEVQQPLEDGLSNTYDRIKQNLITYMQNVGTFIFNSILQIINTVIFLLGFLVIPIWMFYILNDYHHAYQTINRLLPVSFRKDFWAVVKIVDGVMSNYIRGQILLGVVIGFAAGCGLWIIHLLGFKVNNILLLAVVAGVTELIPYIGPVLGAVPAVIVGLFDSPTTALLVLLLYALIQVLENNILVPRVVGESLGIHPAILIVLMIMFGQVFGLLGIILVAPVSAMARDLFRYAYGRLKDNPAPAGVLPTQPTTTTNDHHTS